MNPYEELLAMNPPKLHHLHMPLAERAKIFSPFAALTGHKDALLQMHEIKDTERSLSETEMEDINRQLTSLKKQDRICCTYYDHSVSKYVTVEGTISKILSDQGKLVLDGICTIAISDIIQIESLQDF